MKAISKKEIAEKYLALQKSAKDMDIEVNGRFADVFTLGIRMDYREYNVGDYLAESCNFDEDVRLDDEPLGGTCALADTSVLTEDEEEIAALEGDYKPRYMGDYMYIIGGTTTKGGEDWQEIIVKDAIVLAKWKVA